MQNVWKILPLVVLLTGCSTSEVIKPENYDATKHARLRIFNVENNYAIFSINIDCQTNEKGTKIATDGWDMHWGNTPKQTRIGMTQTEATDKAQEKGIIFKEYVIPAGKVVNISPSLLQQKVTCDALGKCTITTASSCQHGSSNNNNILSKGLNLVGKLLTLGRDRKTSHDSDDRSFIPEAGRQYEYVPAGCNVIIRDITEEKITTVPLSPFFQCPTQ